MGSEAGGHVDTYLFWVWVLAAGWLQTAASCVEYRLLTPGQNYVHVSGYRRRSCGYKEFDLSPAPGTLGLFYGYALNPGR
jgi:hypothetical protein